MKVSRIPNQPRKIYPWLAYVEYNENSLPPLPVLPIIENGKIKGRPRLYQDHECENFHTSDEVSVITESTSA